LRAGFVKVGEINTRYLFAGNGPALILVHGVGLSADTWLRNIDALARGQLVIAPDMINHGFTDLRPYGEAGPHPMLVDHVLAFADALGLARFSIAGSSFGAQIAALAYFQAPHRIEDLIIIGSGSSFNTEAEQAQSIPKTFQNAMSALSDPTWESCRARLANLCHDPQAVPEEIILAQLTSYARSGIVEAYQQTLKGMMDLERARPYRIFERLSSIAVPTLIVWGRQDTRGQVERAIAASRLIPGCELAIFERCGHLPYVEYPEEFNACLDRFLRR
jgi:2-hydroxy-6-oxonona-2,4-dienedioate hydrolase